MEFRNSYVQQTNYIARAIPKCIVTDYLSVTYPKNYIDVTNLGEIIIGRVRARTRGCIVRLGLLLL